MQAHILQCKKLPCWPKSTHFYKVPQVLSPDPDRVCWDCAAPHRDIHSSTFQSTSTAACSPPGQAIMPKINSFDLYSSYHSWTKALWWSSPSTVKEHGRQSYWSTQSMVCVTSFLR